MKTLDEVRSYLSDIDCINCGGCGISSYSMYLWLKKNNLIDDTFKFVLCYTSYCESCYVNNSNVLRSGLGDAIAPSHMVIFYDKQYIDCDRIIDISLYNYVQHVSEEWFIINCLNNLDTWNSMFDRNVIDDIEINLGISLGNIEK